MPDALEIDREVHVVAGRECAAQPGDVAVVEQLVCISLKTTAAGRDGDRFGAEKPSGTPSQLISRWPVADGGPAMLLGFPKKALKAFTWARMSA